MTWLRLIASSSVASHESHHTQSVIAVYPKAMPTLNGLLYVCGARFLPTPISFALDALLSILVLAVAVYLVRTSRHLATSFCAALCATLLLSPHLYLYDYVLLLFPVLLLTERRQPLLTALVYLPPFILFRIGGLDWFALMAFIPALFLTSLLLTQRSHNAHETHPEKVTPHQLTALE